MEEVVHMSNTFYRDKSKGVVAGVCAGLAEYFGVSPVLFRLIFVLLAFSGGPAVPAYLILWIILPEKATLGLPHAPRTERGMEFQDTVHENVQDIQSQARSLGQELQSALGGSGKTEAAPSRRILWLGGILIFVGLVSLAQALNLLSWFRPDMLWALALILAGAVMLGRAVRSK
jgi:phage shock protein PspC (stress-responsive transcriptional regulator)